MLNSTKNWTAIRIGLLIVACIPVILFLLVIGNLAWNSREAIFEIGFQSIFSDKITNSFSAVNIPGAYGLLPAIMGTLQVVILALVIAFPFSLVLAIAASEFSMGWLGQPIELLLSVFSGIPPIIYALTSVFVVMSFIRPKFGGIELADSLIRTLPGLPLFNAGTLPLNQSALLGGIFLALLIIPFMAPLILDAIKDVPQQQKEASLALGATRWFTLQRVILPGAIPGIIAALSLGILKASGDVVISAWTIGFIHDNGLPNPLWDIFERNAPLTSTGAGLLGGMFGTSASTGPSASVANFAALLLLIFAFVILGLVSLTRKWLSRRYQA